MFVFVDFGYSCGRVGAKFMFAVFCNPAVTIVHAKKKCTSDADMSRYELPAIAIFQKLRPDHNNISFVLYMLACCLSAAISINAHAHTHTYTHGIHARKKMDDLCTIRHTKT